MDECDQLKQPQCQFVEIVLISSQNSTDVFLISFSTIITLAMNEQILFAFLSTNISFSSRINRSV